ncbi:MAG: hypothetical protein K8H88_30080 [Sandaracinaceae bacterium]|nr:hypothetical protein [Sandaracinaceae bacterium]
METKINLVLLLTLGATWGAMTLAEPAAALDPRSLDTEELARLEDTFASDRANPEVARELADQYLRLSQPALAVSALSSTPPEVREDPAVLHRLAQAYEETGRMEDAVETAHLALARCGRSLGTADASSLTPAPRFECSERTYAALAMHATALSYMARWGVTDVQHDTRALTAYSLAVRSARFVTASAE